MTLSELGIWLAERLLAPAAVALGVFVFTRRHYLKEETRQDEEAQRAMLKLVARELAGNYRSLSEWLGLPQVMWLVNPEALARLDVFRSYMGEIGALPDSLLDALYQAYSVTAELITWQASFFRGLSEEKVAKNAQVMENALDRAREATATALNAFPDGPKQLAWAKLCMKARVPVPKKDAEPAASGVEEPNSNESDPEDDAEGNA